MSSLKIVDYPSLLLIATLKFSRSIFKNSSPFKLSSTFINISILQLSYWNDCIPRKSLCRFLTIAIVCWYYIPNYFGSLLDQYMTYLKTDTPDRPSLLFCPWNMEIQVRPCRIEFFEEVVLQKEITLSSALYSLIKVLAG